MKPDDEALRFVAEGLGSYRDVSVAILEFQKQAKLMMFAVLEDFADQFARLGCVKRKDNVFLTAEPSIEVESFGNGLWLGIGLQARASGIDAYAFASFNSLTVRDAARVHLKMAALDRDWQQNYEGPRSYVYETIASDHPQEIITVLGEGLRTLLEALQQITEFRDQFDRPRN